MPTGVYKRSKEQLKQIKDLAKKRTGKPLPQKTIDNIKLYYNPNSLKSLLKFNKSRKGKSLEKLYGTEKAKKIKQIFREKKLGKTATLATRKKMSDSRKGKHINQNPKCFFKKGEENPSWIDGRTNDEEYKKSYKKEHYIKNREEIRKKQKGYYQKHKEHIKNKVKKYREIYPTNPQKRREYQREWRKKNHDYSNYLSLRRNVKKKELGGSHTFEEWLQLKKEYDYICPACEKKEPFEKQHCKILTQDHIVSIDKWKIWIKSHQEINYLCDDIENIQPLCQSCNSKKNNKIIKYGKNPIITRKKRSSPEV